MKKIITINLIAFTTLFAVACGDNNNAAPKSDSATTSSTDSSSEPKTGLATGTTNNANVPSPEAATPDSGIKKSMKDSTTMKKP